MAISVDQINLWRQVRSETEVLEFKEAKNQYDFNTLCEYCVALGNEGGGHLLFGIRDAMPRIVVGSKAADNPMGMAEKLFTNLGFRVDVEEVAHPDGRVVVFSIPSRARGTAFNYRGKYLMRSGENLVPMSEDRLRQIFAEGEPDWLEEPSGHPAVGQAKVLELLDTDTFFALLDSPVLTGAAAIERLRNERLIDDVGGGAYSIRRIGAILLANNLADFPELAFKAARVIAYKGQSKLSTPLIDRAGVKGYAVGFQNLVVFINNHLPQYEVIENSLRREIKLVPGIAIRELVANALIHQDMSVTGSSVTIEIYDDRLEVSSPGEPNVPIERLIDGYRSRNERLADFMRRMRICEERGSGIDKVVDAAESLHLPAPDFRAMHKRTLFTIYGPREFDLMDREDRIRACYQHCALK
jgi:ATP-dependent DNA helicase RecG